jgi:hypothetical protein
VRRIIGLLLYGVGIALPIAFAIFGRWYASVWGFSFPLDPIGVLVILLMTGPFSALFFIMGSRLRGGTAAITARGD